MRTGFLSFGFLVIGVLSFAQEHRPAVDTSRVHTKFLSDITVVGRNSKADVHFLPEIVGVNINAGKKNALIVVDNIQGNIVNNTMRQVVAKIPGIQIWESDGSGIQIGIAARGLSPNRSWEFNTRQNGYDIAADPYGYPEAYYTPQLQAVQRIEIVRGQGSLQYGPQFGGMVNFILRNGSEIKKPFEFETNQTIGSNGLFNSFNAIGGEKKQFHYYAFFDHRNADGYRSNSRYYSNSGFGTFTWRLNQKFNITGELMHYNMRSQQPGGLTDAQLQKDIRKSFRSRNWFDITWTTAALIGNYQFAEKTRLNVKLFGVHGDRNSVGYFPSGGVVVADTINKTTGLYNPRNLNTDLYRNYGLEARFLHEYKIGNLKNTVSFGGRLFKGGTYRFAADGNGSSGTDYDMTLNNGVWTRDIDFETINTAFHAENIIRIHKDFILIPGIRYEYISGKASGRNGFSAGNEILLQNQQRKRGFLLAGIGAEYHITSMTELYANITQAYRPVQFADLTAPPTTDSVDQAIKDAKGYNLDLGYRGRFGSFLFFDVSAFYLQYNNRIGTIAQQRGDLSFYNYRTNVGNSTSKGIEAFVEFAPMKIKNATVKGFDWTCFLSYGYTDARYGDFKVIAKNASNVLVESNLRNKKVENAPEHILRTGLTFSFKGVSLTGQLSHVSSAFADANNTITPTANAQNGLIPAYTVTDLTASYIFSKSLQIKAGVNNLTNEFYFTRRSGGYPGPGALPADGRTFFVTVGAKF
ncbi:MAG: TonB-dependent receptor family protein [Lacibacter sp.]